MKLADTFLNRIGHVLARWLTRESPRYRPYTPSDFATLCATLQPGDVLLVEGNQFISASIKYLTQSTWSHAAFYIGDALPDPADGQERPRLIEVDLENGCHATGLSSYQNYNTRICRPVGLSDQDRQAVVDFMLAKLGTHYDLKNIFDLLRYFLPTPPVPVRWRRRMIAFGSGAPTKAICSSLIAQAFQSVKYPILPEITYAPGRSHASSDHSRREILHIRHHSLFAPRDFDLSPYFRIVKPTIEKGFDYKLLTWAGKTSPNDPLRIEIPKAPDQASDQTANSEPSGSVK